MCYYKMHQTGKREMYNCTNENGEKMGRGEEMEWNKSRKKRE